MKSPLKPLSPPSVVTFALLPLLLWMAGCGQGGSTDYEAQQRSETLARSKDPAWKPACDQVAVIRAKGQRKAGTLQSFCVDAAGRLLVCWDAASPQTEPGTTTTAASSGVQVFTPEGDCATTWPLPFGPQAIAMAPSGRIFVAGHGQLARLSAEGVVETTGTSPALSHPPMSDQEIRDLVKDWNTGGADPVEQYRARLERRREDVTGLAVTDEDVFVTCAAPQGFSYAAYRLDHEFRNPKLVVPRLSGCCSQMDIAARGKDLWVAHNGRHKVECYDRDGVLLRSFGRTDRRAADGFGGCCEPKNIRFTPAGTLLCAESGPPVVIKEFTPEGQFKTVVANPTYDSGCVRATVDVSPDGRRFYLLNASAQAIHVFAAKE